jgi:hypothetical protein
MGGRGLGGGHMESWPVGVRDRGRCVGYLVVFSLAGADLVRPTYWACGNVAYL